MFRLLFVFVLLFFIVSSSYGKEGDFTLTKHTDKTYSIDSRGASLLAVLDRVKKESGIKAHLDPTLKDKVISVQAKRVSLKELLERVAKDNFALVYKGDQVVMFHGLPYGTSKPSGIRPGYAGLPPWLHSTEEEIQYFIDLRRAALERIAEKTPNKEIKAQISFHDYIETLPELMMFIRKNNLKPVEINSGWRDMQGHIEIRPGENLEAVFKELKEFEKEGLEYNERALADEETTHHMFNLVDPADKAGFMEYSRNIKEEIALVKKNGHLPFTGMIVEAKAGSLKELTKNELIRLIDPVEGQSSMNPLLIDPEKETNKEKKP